MDGQVTCASVEGGYPSTRPSQDTHFSGIMKVRQARPGQCLIFILTVCGKLVVSVPYFHIKFN